MIIICPACETRFLIDEEALGAVEGRRMRCASCGNLWSYSAEAAEIQASVAEIRAEAEVAAVASGATVATAVPSQEVGRTEHRREFQPHPAGRGAQPRPPVVELPAAARRRAVRAIGLGLIVIAIGAVVGAILGRDKILALWPWTAPVYASLHLIEQPGAGLTLTVLPPQTDDGFVVSGNIVNQAAEPRRVPRLRVTLRDGFESDLESKVIDPPVDRLPPGIIAHFTTTFTHPSITATGVEVTFATE